MTTPTQTEYGPEIACSGRPSWLGDDEKVWPHWGYDSGHWYSMGAVPAMCVGDWPSVSKIKLPATHPASIVAAHNAKHGTQFKYWPGGDEAPGDYDGGVYLCRDGETYWMNGYGWKHGDGSYGKPADWDRIGYTPKPCADVNDGKTRFSNDWPSMAGGAKAKLNLGSDCPTCDGTGVSKAYGYDGEEIDVGCPDCPAQPDFVPCERTLRMAIEKVSAIKSHTIRSAARCALEMLLPKSVRADELARSFRLNSYEHISDEDMGLLRLFARHLIAQGEIRG